MFYEDVQIKEILKLKKSMRALGWEERKDKVDLEFTKRIAFEHGRES